MLVVAFDGILFDTLAFRATAIVEALAAEGIEADQQSVLAILPSRSLAEAVRVAVQPACVDETTLDLAAMRAERAIGELGSRGALLNVAVRDRLRSAASVTRIVVRADSRRREAEQLMAMAELESIVSFLCCSDDHSVHRAEHSVHTTESREILSPTSPAPLSSLQRSYSNIARRLYGNMSLLGTAAGIGIALEVSEPGREVARSHGFGTPDSFDAAHLHGR